MFSSSTTFQNTLSLNRLNCSLADLFWHRRWRTCRPIRVEFGCVDGHFPLIWPGGERTGRARLSRDSRASRRGTRQRLHFTSRRLNWLGLPATSNGPVRPVVEHLQRPSVFLVQQLLELHSLRRPLLRPSAHMFARARDSVTRSSTTGHRLGCLRARKKYLPDCRLGERCMLLRPCWGQMDGDSAMTTSAVAIPGLPARPASYSFLPGDRK